MSKKWLRWLQIGLLVSDIGLILTYAYVHFGHVSPTAQKLWGNNPLILVVCGIHIIYVAAAYVWFEKRNLWISNAVSMALFGITLAVILEITGNVNYFYQAMYLVLAFFFAMIGPIIPIAAGALVFILFFFTLLGVSANTGLALGIPITLGLDFGSIFLSFLGWWIFKSHYVDSASSGMAQLSGLVQTKQQLSEILIQSIADGIIVTDTEGKITLLNPAAAKLTGWPLQDAMGIDVDLVAKLLQEDGKEIEAEAKPFKRLLKTGKQSEGTLQLTERDGKNHRVVSLVVSPVVQPGSTEIAGAVAVFRDISASREEEHRRADFISTASHEMRTPVAAIEGYLALALNDKVSHIDTKARDYLTKAHESTQHLGKLFQDLLTSAKAEDGRLVNHPVLTEISGFLEQITDGLRFAAEKKGLLMDYTVGSGEEGASNVAGGKVVRPLYYANVDPDRMREVITNLFDNAVKYTETGKVSIGLTGNNDVIQFYIRDTGSGIPPEDVPHLFQKFYRVDNSATRTIGGTGLGLYICRKIIELYNGRIWVESEVGKGSTFYLNLPRLSAQKAGELQVNESPSK